ncbi:MAG TPA: class I SAM-dependent methyltransferase [Gemmatimonadota bacterium]|jgi:demethylmenaquinone methyltransferase/2-methoxy-6-polyprenyl-1,4-benzoquinol methylase
MTSDGFHDRTIGQAEKAARVREMFDALAPRYDLFNDVLSAGIHRRWREDAIDLLDPRPGARYLDLCAGTLDLARGVKHRAPRARVVGADFSLPMLARGRAKLGPSKLGPDGAGIQPVAADALRLPFADGAFRGLVIGFGLRNLADIGAGLAEMARVLEPGGRLVVLEFTTPPGRVFRALYHAYFHHALPRLGSLISGQPAAARYLPDSVTRFPRAGEFAEMIAESGFGRVRFRYLTRGIAALHFGLKE